MKIFKSLFIPALVFCVTLLGLFYAFEYSQKNKISDLKRGVSKVYKIVKPGHRKVPGLYPLADSEVEGVLTIDGREIYRRRYLTDSFYRRVPLPPPVSKFKGEVIMSGCSFIWGEGLPVEETMPYFVQRRHPELRIHNLGFSGGGIQTLIRHMEKSQIETELKDRNGFYLYFFLSDHLNRFLSRYNYLSWVGSDMPYYEVVDGKIVDKVNYESSERYHNMQRAKKVGLENSLINSDPKFYSDTELDDFVTAVVYLKSLVSWKLPNLKFVFLTHPIGDIPVQQRERLHQTLKARGVEVYDVTEVFYALLERLKLTHGQMILKGDGHPVKRYNELMAPLLDPLLSEGR